MISYIEFLGNITGRGDEYSMLLEQLHGIEFFSLVPNDDNRGSDGVRLRDLYLDEVGPQGASSLPVDEYSSFTDMFVGNDSAPCTVLEMLIGVAFRIEFDMSGGRYGRPSGEWFWVLMDNLGLEMCDNVVLGQQEARDYVNEKIDILLNRRYDSDGNGGLFPLKANSKSVTTGGQKCHKDQRRVEIWYQMSAWIIENYPI